MHYFGSHACSAIDTHLLAKCQLAKLVRRREIACNDCTEQNKSAVATIKHTKRYLLTRVSYTLAINHAWHDEIPTA